MVRGPHLEVYGQHWSGLVIITKTKKGRQSQWREMKVVWAELGGNMIKMHCTKFWEINNK